MVDEPECGVPEDELRKLYAALGDNREARDILWRLEQGARGVYLANSDLHKAIEEQQGLVYRELIVREVIRLQRVYEASTGTNARIAAIAALGEATRKLAEWKL